MSVEPIRRYLSVEATSGIVLGVATLAALIWANSGFGTTYEHFFEASLNRDAFGPLGALSVRGFINDALMCVFFYVAGLEIKREWRSGALRDRRFARLPIVAAIGGMIIPALLYLGIAGTTSGAHGWGIPMATDIAFMIAITAALGARVPLPVKTFLLTLAIVDDLGSIIVIAVFYAGPLNGAWIAVAFGLAGVLGVMRLCNVGPWRWYVPVGLVLWYATWQSGVHATIAGVVLALFTPLEHLGRPLLSNVLERLHRPTNFVIVPVFALANAGVRLGGLPTSDGLRVGAGIVVGLVVGKAIGIVGASWVAVRWKWATLGAGMQWGDLIGAGCLAGIGFTMSLFFTQLAFSSTTPALADDAKRAILLASLLSAALGSTLFILRGKQRSNY